MSITAQERVDRISGDDLETLADALAQIILSVASESRPTISDNPIAEEKLAFEKNRKLDNYKRMTAREYSRNIPSVLQTFIYIIVNHPDIIVRKQDDPSASAEQIEEDAEWLFYKDHTDLEATEERLNIGTAIVVMSALFAIISSPTETII